MSGESWKLTAHADRARIEAALAAQEEVADWDEEVVLTACEVAENHPDEWRLDAYLPRDPTDEDRTALTSLFAGNAPSFAAEQLPDADWVTESQRGLEPIRVARFFVRTPDHLAPDRLDVVDLVIPAAQAFGTGQHATTEGCLAMLDSMERFGSAPANIIDVGTGTGLLAFAALRLWPEARIAASDIDPVCEDVLRENAALNMIGLGDGPGRIMPIVAAGLDHPDLTARAPYDLLIANILAGPLNDLAPEFAKHVAPGGSVILSGLLTSQQDQVVANYEASGFRLLEENAIGDWAILRLCKPASPADS